MSNEKSKKGFLAGIADEVLTEVDAMKAAEPERKQLVQRSTAISRMSSDVIYNQFELIDPSLCRPSAENARDYDALTYEQCETLIRSIQEEGGQKTPALVRPTGDEEVPYEIVAGMRRHWAITWLRTNNYPDFKYLVDIEKMDDETAFRMSDLENRERSDVTDYERSVSYKRALTAHYGGNVQHMAKRLALAEPTLYTYLALANLDTRIIAALGGSAATKIAHLKTLSPVLKKSPAHATAILEAANEIAAEQERRRGQGEQQVPAHEVVKQLVKASERRPARGPSKSFQPIEIKSQDGKTMVEYVLGSARTAGSIKIYRSSGATIDEIRRAALDALNEMLAKGQSDG